LTTVHLNLVAMDRFRRHAAEAPVRKILQETRDLARKWPRTGNPAWTDTTGALKRSITTTFNAGVNPSGTVGSKLSYAMAVHNGTKGRYIYARVGKRMKFRWKRMGYVTVYRRYVWHPPVRGSFYLTNPLTVVARRHGFATRRVR
jgi:hypothetical protein